MVEVMLPNLFRIEVPLPKNPLKSVNSYVVTSGDRNLVVDTAMNRPECRDALEAGFRELNIDRMRTDFLITHFHADHVGLVTAFATEESRVYFNEPEAQFMSTFKTSVFLKSLVERARASGFPIAGLEDSLKQHPGIRYSPPNYPEFTILRDGDALAVGDYRFTCVHTPGHSPGHMCFYEPNKRVFLSGDHVLGDITPNISAGMDDKDTLGEYLASLDKVSHLDVVLVLPGHRRAFSDLQSRVQELKCHHQLRAEEALTILEMGALTAYEVAARMKWDIVAESWEQFPLMQKWFAVGEAAAHLRYLETEGAVYKVMREGVFLYVMA